LASTTTLNRTIQYCQQFVRNAPLTFSGTNDPAFFNADWVRQFILSPPFSWRWNRGSVTIDLQQGQQDYVVNLPTFGWLEKASVVNAVAPPNGPQSWQLNISTDLTVESNQQVPTHIGAQSDDGNGNITFRVFPVPDRSYTITIEFQGQSPTFKNVNETWSPIPDYLSYLYNQGMLAKTYEYLGDSRFGESVTLFVRQLVACSEGLDDTERNIFLNGRINTLRETIEAQGGRQGKQIL
jgi:hypothetical protein